MTNKTRTEGAIAGNTAIERKGPTMYTREQLEVMDPTGLGLQVGKFCDDFANDPDAWLTGDGMLALMEWCRGNGFVVYVELRPGSLCWCMAHHVGSEHPWHIAEHASAPRALAIAVVLAVQGQEPDRVV